MNGTDLRTADAPRARRRLSTGQWVRLSLITAVIVGLGAAAGYVTALLLPVKYAAHAEVLYALTREQPTGFLREDRNITTQTVLLESRSVLGPVAEEWDVPIEKLSEAIEASVISGSEIIEITLTDRDPDRAQRMLRTVVNRYLEVSGNDDRMDLRAYLDEVLDEVLDRISEALDDDRGGELAALVEREQWLRTQLDELEFSDIAGPAASVLVRPYVEADPVSPRPVIATAAGAATALIAALVVVAVVARRMTRL